MSSYFELLLQRVNIAVPAMKGKLRNLGRLLFDQVTCDMHLMEFASSGKPTGIKYCYVRGALGIMALYTCRNRPSPLRKYLKRALKSVCLGGILGFRRHDRLFEGTALVAALAYFALRPNTCLVSLVHSSSAMFQFSGTIRRGR